MEPVSTDRTELRVIDSFSISRMLIQDGKDTSFQIFGAKPPGKAPGPRRLHHHSHYELVYVAEGELTQHFETGSFRYQQGDCCFLNRNTRHLEGFETDCLLYFVNLPPTFLRNLFTIQDVAFLKPQYEAGPLAAFILENQEETSEYMDFAAALGMKEPAVTTLLMQLIQEMELAETGYIYRIKALLLQLIAELENPVHYHSTRIRVDSHPEEFIYMRALRYLEERHGRASREELGAILHYNGDYLNRIIKRQSGLTLTKLGQEIAIREAKRLLMDETCSVSEVIHELGYTNRSHFYQMFREETGMHPGEWRRSVHQLAAKKV